MKQPRTPLQLLLSDRACSRPSWTRPRDIEASLSGRTPSKINTEELHFPRTGNKNNKITRRHAFFVCVCFFFFSFFFTSSTRLVHSLSRPFRRRWNNFDREQFISHRKQSELCDTGSKYLKHIEIRSWGHMGATHHNGLLINEHVTRSQRTSDL